MRTLQETDVWDITFFHHVWLGLFTIISWRSVLLDLLPDVICRLRFNCASCMTRATTFPSCILGILAQQCVCGRDGPPAWPAHYPDLNPLHVYRWWQLKSTVLCYRSQRRPGLETANTEWIAGDSFEAWNFPASQAITFQTRNVLCWSWKWTLEYFLSSSGSHGWEGLSVFIKMFFLFCGVDL